jgi:hypothetical protein
VYAGTAGAVEPDRLQTGRQEPRGQRAVEHVADRISLERRAATDTDVRGVGGRPLGLGAGQGGVVQDGRAHDRAEREERGRRHGDLAHGAARR